MIHSLEWKILINPLGSKLERLIKNRLSETSKANIKCAHMVCVNRSAYKIENVS